MTFIKGLTVQTLFLLSAISAAQAEALCTGFGPQTPRDITNKAGKNTAAVAFAPAANKLNLCDIHTHTNAEHKGPGFSVFAGDGKYGGFKCNETDQLTPQELAEPAGNAYKGVKPGDTLEVHWVYSSCDITPGNGLGTCLSDACANPQLRVETQVFLVVNDPKAANFLDFGYGGTIRNGLHQAKALPEGTGDPVTFIGSTTGPSYTQEVCSPLQVTWSVRPQCTKLDINSLNAWVENGNVFKEDQSHGIRPLVTAEELLAPIN
ncbi:delta-class carbonic anhydrase [Roseibium sp.]|uniref:delta-class carbonic anhydrase n=1 Tax=Roseibium sp. TaxID=1936156 RepID=UPI003D112F61